MFLVHTPSVGRMSEVEEAWHICCLQFLQQLFPLNHLTAQEKVDRPVFV